MMSVSDPDEGPNRALRQGCHLIPYDWQLWVLLLLGLSCGVELVASPAGFGNPVMRGADPHALVRDGVVWVYPTWGRGGQQFYAFSSTNLQTWERHGPVLDFKDVRWIKDDGRNYHQAWAPGVARKADAIISTIQWVRRAKRLRESEWQWAPDRRGHSSIPANRC